VGTGAGTARREDECVGGMAAGRATGTDERDVESDDAAGRQTDTPRTGGPSPLPVPSPGVTAPRQLGGPGAAETRGQQQQRMHLPPPARATLQHRGRGANAHVPAAARTRSLQPRAAACRRRAPRGERQGTDSCDTGPQGAEGEAPHPSRAPGGAHRPPPLRDARSRAPPSEHSQPQDQPEQREGGIRERTGLSPPCPVPPRAGCPRSSGPHGMTTGTPSSLGQDGGWDTQPFPTTRART